MTTTTPHFIRSSPTNIFILRFQNRLGFRKIRWASETILLSEVLRSREPRSPIFLLIKLSKKS